MRDAGLDDHNVVPPVLPDVPLRTGQTDRKSHSTRSTRSGRTGPTSNVSSKHNASTRPAKFGTLPLQEARVLQQLQTLSITAAPADKATFGRPIKQFVPKRKPSFVKQPKLRRSKVDLTGNTDSEVDSPQSQAVLHQRHSPEALVARQTKALPAAASQSALNVADACSHAYGTPAVCTVPPGLLSSQSPISAQASAVTPARTALHLLPDCITDTPESMAMSTPACGQALPSSATSTILPMSCSTTGNQSARHLRNAAAPLAGSPMCISPDTWATPQQLQWELPSNSLPAVQDPPQPPTRAFSPSASQLHLANLQFGLDAINEAAAAAATAAAGTRRRSRLASRTMADLADNDTDANNIGELEGCSGASGGVEEWSQGSNRAFGGFAEDAEWLEDLEVTPTLSQEDLSTPTEGASSPQAELQLTLGSEDEGSQHILSPQVQGLHIEMCPDVLGAPNGIFAPSYSLPFPDFKRSNVCTCKA